jgi:signal peptidase I
MRGVVMKIIRNFMKEWLVPLVVAAIIALLINRFLVFKITVPSGSMIPTIEIGDQIFTYRVYNLNNLKRGDIVVFNSDELKIRLVKRLIGLPGEKVDLKEGGKLYINDKKVDEPYVVNHDSVNISFKVPAGHYLFLGDNRPISHDARYWKNPYIPADKIEGKAILRVYPFNKIGIVK